jgi:hypothetical protein
MTPEQSFWKLLKPHIPGHVCRIENSCGSGMPDVNFCYQCRDIWLEIKADKLIPDNSRVGDSVVNPPCIRESQKIWHRARHLEGGDVIVVGRYKDTIVGLCTTRDIGVYRVELIASKPWNWENIEKFLSGE